MWPWSEPERGCEDFFGNPGIEILFLHWLSKRCKVWSCCRTVFSWKRAPGQKPHGYWELIKDNVSGIRGETNWKRLKSEVGMGGGGEWWSETRFREVWLLQETESWGGFGRQGQEHFAFVFSQQRGTPAHVMFTGDSAKGKSRWFGRRVDNWWCPIACVKGWLWSTEGNDQCPVWGF